MRRGLMPVALGLRLGLEIALVFSRSLAGLLHGITATDSTIYFSVCMLMLSVAPVAVYIPARRATRVDRVVALRDE